jgi:serine protease inhibitor
MFVVVPADLETFEADLTPEKLDAIVGEIRDGGIHLSMPRLTYRYHAALEPALRTLGLGSLFDAPDFPESARAGSVSAPWNTRPSSKWMKMARAQPPQRG